MSERDNFEISNYFDFQLNSQQIQAFERLIGFSHDLSSKIFVLKGHAGTGKTSLIKGLIKYFNEFEEKYVLLASTGRASKVLSNITGSISSTIHSHIYAFNKLDEDLEEISKLQEDFSKDDKGQIRLNFDLKLIEDDSNCIYIVDESSMISNNSGNNTSFAQFGSGKLLSDLLKFDPNGKFVFVGDPCQLPPVNPANKNISPALSVTYFAENLDTKAEEYELTKIVRQSLDNGIIEAAKRLRQLYHKNPKVKWAKLPAKGYNEIDLLNSQMELINEYSLTLKKGNLDKGIMICQTNKNCLEVNRIIKGILGKDPKKLEVGDLLMVTQNNYACKLVNGDQVLIKGIGAREYRCGLSFLRVQIEELSSGQQFSILIIEDVLFSARVNITDEEHKKLLIDYFYRMKEKGVGQDSEIFNQNMYTDPYINALKAVFGFAITCHKSQGGEWDKVFLFQDNKIHGIPKPNIYQWWYTAITRAKTNLFLVDDWFIL